MKRVVLGAAAALLAVAAWSAAAHPWGWAFAFGVHPYPDGTPWTYQLESGFLPALTVLSLLGALSSLYHVKNCHWPGCWRLGRHAVNGSPWCNRHYHEVKPEKTLNELVAELCTAVTALTRLIGDKA